MLSFKHGATHLRRLSAGRTLSLRYPARHLSTTTDKPFYITTPIFYPNAVPHIGHLHSVVIADIFARHARLSRPDRPVHFMTGTDEHGLKIQKAARERGLDPLVFCDELSTHFRNLANKANISNTRFSRTTEQSHRDAVQHLWRELDAKGLIYKGNHEGWYSISDECFYTDGQVTCVDATNGEDAYYISAETGSRVEWTQEENYKFRLSAFRESLLEHFKGHPDAVFPQQHYLDVLATLNGSLEDLSVSRPQSRLSWGITVPNDPEHTIYVWIDALTVYLSATGYPWKTPAAIKEAWPPNIQIIGKDILRFHAIYFPAMLQALGLPLTQRLLTHSHWTVEQRKMSKSVGNVADPIEAIDEFGLDVVRYYLARVGGRFKDDVDWSRDQLEKHSKEIMSLLGNSYLRITSKKIQQRVGSEVRPSVKTLLSNLPADSPLWRLGTVLHGLSEKVDVQMDKLLVADALGDVMHALRTVNEVMTEVAPWSPKTNTETVIAAEATVLEALRICAILLQPFIPGKAAMLLNALGVPEGERNIQHAALGAAQAGTVSSGIRLFELTKPASGA